jgi:hypothetical protein
LLSKKLQREIVYDLPRDQEIGSDILSCLLTPSLCQMGIIE